MFRVEPPCGEFARFRQRRPIRIDVPIVPQTGRQNPGKWLPTRSDHAAFDDTAGIEDEIHFYRFLVRFCIDRGKGLVVRRRQASRQPGRRGFLGDGVFLPVRAEGDDSSAGHRDEAECAVVGNGHEVVVGIGEGPHERLGGVRFLREYEVTDVTGHRLAGLLVPGGHVHEDAGRQVHIHSRLRKYFLCRHGFHDGQVRLVLRGPNADAIALAARQAGKAITAILIRDGVIDRVLAEVGPRQAIALNKGAGNRGFRGLVAHRADHDLTRRSGVLEAVPTEKCLLGWANVFGVLNYVARPGQERFRVRRLGTGHDEQGLRFDGRSFDAKLDELLPREAR